MTCVSYCLLGAALVGSSILTMMTSKSAPVFVKFNNLLDANQKQIYKSILNERASIYAQSLILGIVIACLVVFNLPRPKSKSVKISKGCLFVLLALGVNYLGYSLYPKSTYMLNHLHNAQQNKAWVAIYKEMKFRCMFGLILGALGYLVLARGICV